MGFSQDEHTPLLQSQRLPTLVNIIEFPASSAKCIKLVSIGDQGVIITVKLRIG
jgi:hypothetical protein